METMRVLETNQRLSASLMKQGYLHYKEGIDGSFLMLSWEPEGRRYVLEGSIHSEEQREGIKTWYSNLQIALRCYRILSSKFEGEEYHLAPLETVA